MKLSAVQADITTLDVDAIVNAANTGLSGGGGVDGAIHDAAGPELMTACSALGGCSTGDAKMTPGFGLPSRYVIHAVGPIWDDGSCGEPEALVSCYRRAMELVRGNNLQSVAFSAISTGVYGYPKIPATNIAVHTVMNFLKETSADIEVVFCCFSAGDLELYKQTIAKHLD